VDFWAQHKDFVLRVLAGLGVFLVALIARGIVYGDDLEKAKGDNSRLASALRGKSLATSDEITAAEANAKKLQANAAEIAGMIGFAGGDPDLELTLIRRTLGYLRRFRGEGAGELDAEALAARQSIRDNLNGGFGQLRLVVRDELAEEADIQNIKVSEGLGFENVTDMEGAELVKYLLQLELAARVVRYGIDARVGMVEEIRIDAGRETEVIPGANPDFLREYPVEIRLRGTQEATLKVLNRLEAEPPTVPWRGLRIDRSERPADHVIATITLLAIAAQPAVEFAPKEKGP